LEVWLSPTGLINLGFTTEGRLAAVLIIPSSWGSHRGVIYTPSERSLSSNNFQDSTKRKSTEKKTMGYLPRVLFFNAFELGAESGNQVISSDEASSS
jgi:hypothetical protein